MTETIIPTEYGDRQLTVVNYNTDAKRVELYIKNLHYGHIELAWLADEGARDLVAALVEKFGEGILPTPPKPKTKNELTMESFAKLDIGDRFEMTRPGRIAEGRPPYRGTKIGEDLIDFEAARGFGRHPSQWRAYAWTFTKIEKPSVQDGIKALAVGDTFVVDYDNGRQTKAVKVSDEEYFSYTTNALKRIGNISWKGTVTKTGSVTKN